VNADIIARGLAGFSADAAALEAGAIMLRRVHQLADQGVSFGFETTLASRTFAPWLRGLIQNGYHFHLIFLWLPHADMAVFRVAQRVRRGGHSVPESTIRRRFVLGLKNLRHLYCPLAATWRVYDNSQRGVPQLIAAGKSAGTVKIVDPDKWDTIEREA